MAAFAIWPSIDIGSEMYVENVCLVDVYGWARPAEDSVAGIVR